VHDWLTDLLSTPVKDYTNFEAALSFLPALPPDDVAALLRERAARLEFDLAGSQGSRELIEKKHFPRLLWVEEEFRMVLREAELAYVRKLVREIENGTLEGMEWWRRVHASGDEPVPSPLPLTSGLEQETGP
jgi:Xaa-Pro aminopeptidase